MVILGESGDDCSPDAISFLRTESSRGLIVTCLSFFGGVVLTPLFPKPKLFLFLFCGVLLFDFCVVLEFLVLFTFLLLFVLLAVLFFGGDIFLFVFRYRVVLLHFITSFLYLLHNLKCLASVIFLPFCSFSFT